MKTDRELLEHALKLIYKYHARETVLVDWEKSVIEDIKARLAEDDEGPVAWLRLTDDEISQVGKDSKSVEGNHTLPFTFARAIERKIWEKRNDF